MEAVDKIENISRVLYMFNICNCLQIITINDRIKYKFIEKFNYFNLIWIIAYI